MDIYFDTGTKNISLGKLEKDKIFQIAEAAKKKPYAKVVSFKLFYGI